MALNTGPLPKGIPTSVARTDFNDAMNQLDAAFPLQAVNIANPLRMKTGVYNGDGTTPRAIIGIGFKPRFVIVYVHVAGEYPNPCLKTDQDLFFSGAPFLAGAITEWKYDPEMIISLDADGFTVGNSAGTNENGQAYTYIAFG